MKKLYKYLFFCLLSIAWMTVSAVAQNQAGIQQVAPTKNNVKAVVHQDSITNDIWQEAIKSYSDANYSEALKEFVKLDSMGYKSAILYYNMGNTYYKMDNYLSHAILYYERSLKLDPSNKDVLNNLEMANNLCLDKIDTVPEFIMVKWFNNLMNIFSSNSWAWMSLGFFILIGLLLLVFRFSGSKGIRKTSFIISLISFAFFILSLCFAIKLNSQIKSENEAIVITPVCSVKAAPNESGKALFVLHEGTKLETIENLGEWKRIELADGRQGWLEERHIETI
ncbi:MAG: tetratricopeptide repeat protein [Bacteroidales bacterium]